MQLDREGSNVPEVEGVPLSAVQNTALYVDVIHMLYSHSLERWSWQIWEPEVNGADY